MQKPFITEECSRALRGDKLIFKWRAAALMDRLARKQTEAQSTCERLRPRQFPLVSRFQLIFLCGSFLPSAKPVADEDCKVIRTDGRDYVSFANVAQFCRFPQDISVRPPVKLAQRPSATIRSSK